MVWVAGQKLQGNKYTIEKPLGEGGFSITYLARNQNEQHVVIKTLNDRVQRRPDFAKFQQDFLNEALRLAKCTHPHIVRIEELLQEGELCCMVMEYIAGEDLASRVRTWGAIPEAEALRYIQQIGDALSVVHSKGLLHRDVKPENIMLRANGSGAVLMDFGTAREFTPNLNQTHTPLMTNYFAPIEQYDEQAPMGAYTDVYALAATLYVLLTGELPILAPVRAAGVPLEAPKQLNPSISNRVNQAILQGMAFQARERPQSVQEWLGLLGVKATFVSPNIKKQGKKIAASSRQLRSLPWGDLIAFFMGSALAGYLLSLYSTPDLVLSVALTVDFLAVSLAAKSSGCLSIVTFLAWAIAGIINLGWAVYLVWTATVPWGGIILGIVVGLAAAASILVMAFLSVGSGVSAAQRLLKSFSRFHTFLILLTTSWLGLGLAWLLRYINALLHS
jgi:serine/threonine protein kinase